jgi:hypothetical protein
MSYPSNHNPANIRYNKVNNWKGQLKSDENGFCKFQSDFYGIRALSMLVDHYFKEGHNTIESFISQYSPPTENNTTALLNTYSHLLFNLPVSAPIPDKFMLMSAIITVEQGIRIYNHIELKEILESNNQVKV